MKILTKGNKDWPHAVKNHCRECGTVYQLEDGDPFRRLPVSRTMADYIETTCPVCGCTVRTDNPNTAHSWLGPETNLGGRIA